MARKDVSLVVSGAGWIAGFADKLIRELRTRNVSDEQIHSLVTDDGDVAVARIADALAEVMGAVKNLFRVGVHYVSTVEEMVAAGKYDWVNDNITHEHFPHDRDQGTESVAVELLHYGRRMSSDEVLADMDRNGFRPATLPELLALGKEHPNLQREFPIVALGSVWRDPDGGRDVAYLYRLGAERYLYLGWLGDGWREVFRFAAVRTSR